MDVRVLLMVGACGAVAAGCGDDPVDLPPTTSSSTGSQGGGGSMTTGGGMGGMGASGGMGGSGGSVSPTCGDGNVDFQAGEECDDGNNAGGDGCSAACQIEAAPTCGDGVLDLVNDEECDDGNNVSGDGCSAACQIELVGQLCGDGQVQAPEVCDDGNIANGDGCNPTCNMTGTTSLFAGSPGQPGNLDGIGQAARFGGSGVFTINATHIFMSEEQNHTIRRIEVATALVQTIAGDAIGGAAGYVDDPVGANARFGNIGALATDGSTVWIADGGNHVIRAMSTTAPYAVTTVAGTAGNQGCADGIGPAAQFNDIRGLTYFNGFVYYVDANCQTLRRFNPATGEVLTLAGMQTMNPISVDGFGLNARFVSPRYIANDGSGMLYIADTNGNKIRAYNTVTTEVTTFAGSGACGYADGTGAAALIHRPRGMTSDGTSIYWVEFNAHTIRQARVATADVSTFAGSVPAQCLLDCSCMQTQNGSYVEGVGAAAAFDFPFNVVFHYPSNSLFVMDGGNNVIRRIQ